MTNNLVSQYSFTALPHYTAQISNLSDSCYMRQPPNLEVWGEVIGGGGPTPIIGHAEIAPITRRSAAQNQSGNITHRRTEP